MGLVTCVAVGLLLSVTWQPTIARPLLLPAGNETDVAAHNGTRRQLLVNGQENYDWGPWNKATATFFNGWENCHCGYDGMSCSQPGDAAVAMPKSFYDSQGHHGDWDTWDASGNSAWFGQRGMCGACLEIQCVGCHDNANGHAGCTNGFKGCRGDGSSIIVKVLDLLWEGDANRNTVAAHDSNIVPNWNDCTDYDYCPRGDGSDYAKRIDMYSPAYASIADPVTGLIKVQWRFAPDNAC